MSGIYIHIPFCKQACHYCDFHFSTNMRLKDDMLKAILKEIELQNSFFNDQNIISSIYFGGGTPSLLSINEIKLILSKIRQYHKVSKDVEVTLEANPDDISKNKLEGLYNVGINRLSLGIQSFNPRILKWMNRSHSASQAFESLNTIANSPINDFSVDLIYGNQNQTLTELRHDINQLLEYNPPHISAYCLTIEEKTVFGKLLQRGKLNEVDEDTAAAHFILVNELLVAKGYEQYEVSNYSLPGKASFHNTNYWKGIPYLGLGPGAHSYNGEYRQYNISNNPKYIKALSVGEVPAEKEVLSKADKINEYIMTALRTSEGLSFDKMVKEHQIDLQGEYQTLIQNWQKQNLVDDSNSNFLRLTLKGKLIADKLAADLFIIS